MRLLGSILCLGSAAILLSSTGAARADERTSAAAEADRLFKEGRALMAEDRHGEACPKLAESQRLDPGAGTLLNLAECYEHLGKLASAYRAYRDAASLSRASGRRERAEHAMARAASLLPRVPMLTVVVVRAPAGELEVRRNGERLVEAAWSTPMQVDPGEQTIEAKAPGFAPWVKHVELRAGDRVAVEVPELEPAEPPTPEAPTPTPASRPGAGAQLIAGWAVAGVGAAALVAGGAFALVARAKNDEARGGPCSEVDCDARGIELIGEAKDAAAASTVLVLVGAAAVAGGLSLVLTAPSNQTQQRASVRARVAVHPYGVTLGGSF